MQALERRSLAVLLTTVLVGLWLIAGMSHWLAFLLLLAVLGSIALLVRQRERLPSGTAATRQTLTFMWIAPPILFAVGWVEDGWELATVFGAGALLGTAAGSLIVRAIRPVAQDDGE